MFSIFFSHKKFFIKMFFHHDKFVSPNNVLMSKLVHIPTLYLSGTEGYLPRFQALSEHFLEFEVSRLAQNSLPSLVWCLLTSLVLNNFSSIFDNHTNLMVKSMSGYDPMRWKKKLQILRMLCNILYKNNGSLIKNHEASVLLS